MYKVWPFLFSCDLLFQGSNWCLLLCSYCYQNIVAFGLKTVEFYGRCLELCMSRARVLTTRLLRLLVHGTGNKKMKFFLVPTLIQLMQASLPSPNNVPRSCCLHLDLGYRESPASPTKRSVSVCVWYQWLYFLPVQREYLLVKTGICQSDGGSAWRYNGVLHPTGVPFINKPKLVHFVNKPKQLTQNIICIEVFIFIRVLIVLTWFKIQSQWFWKVWKRELCFWGKLWFDWSRV